MCNKCKKVSMIVEGKCVECGKEVDILAVLKYYIDRCDKKLSKEYAPPTEEYVKNRKFSPLCGWSTELEED